MIASFSYESTPCKDLHSLRRREVTALNGDWDFQVTTKSLKSQGSLAARTGYGENVDSADSETYVRFARDAPCLLR